MANLYISQFKQYPPTYREVMEGLYSELWGQANECVDQLIGLQTIIIPTIKSSWKPIAYCTKLIDDALREKQYQLFFIEQLYFRSLYGFAEMIWRTIKRQLRNIAKAKVSNNQKEVEKAINTLENTLAIASKIKWEELANDHATGLLRLKCILKKFKRPSDFAVLYSGSTNYSTWTFKPMIDLLENFGIEDASSLWNYTIGSACPKRSNIKSLNTDKSLLKVVSQK